MYVDFSVPINEKLPKYVKEQIREVEEAYRANDDILYIMKTEPLEVSIRDAYAEGILTEKEFKEMYDRFDWC